MSPVSRGRKRKNNGGKLARSRGGFTSPDLLGEQGHCDCPICSAEGSDPGLLVDQLLDDTSDLLDVSSALDAEVTGASLVRLAAIAGGELEDVFADGFVPAIEARARPEALAMLLAIGSVSRRRLGEAASAASGRLVKAGVARPEWADELAQPLLVTGCRRLGDPTESASLLICSFQRAGQEHSFVVAVDHLDCGAAVSILLLEPDELDTVLAALRSGSGSRIVEEVLEPAELRWQVENALDARAHHDRDEGVLGMAELFTDSDDSDGPDDYPPMAELLRARMSSLPAPSRPKAPHQHGSGGTPALGSLELPADDLDDLFASPPSRARRKRGTTLPAKRSRSAKPAPIYQIKVGLRGAKPPIWRRLEVPADVSLAELHIIIQRAFGWDDSHMHVFTTPHGEFGVADADSDIRSEDPVTLEQVAPLVKSTIRYTYDMGDDWEHDILVERTLDRDDTVDYPRCTAGRRACPPEDCGGIWGYANLVEILADPSHPDHQEMMDWMGLSDPGDFDPGRFNADEVSQALAPLR
jgi:hypothetical protein